MKNIEFNPIGFVRNNFNKTADYNLIKKEISEIVVYKEYSEALLSISEREYLDVFFNFHKSESGKLSGKTHSGKVRGVFASRSPKRPNLIGHTSVKLISVEGNILKVTGLDAINNSPVIDIKSSDTSLFASEKEMNKLYISQLKSNPRIEIWNNISAKKFEMLMIKAAEFHGHFCPGLALGILASVFVMNKLKINQKQEKQLSVEYKKRNCLIDGIQYITSCTTAKNNLIFMPDNDADFTFKHQDGRILKLNQNDNSEKFIKRFPDYYKLTEKANKELISDEELAKLSKLKLERAFGILKYDAEDLFKVVL